MKRKAQTSDEVGDEYHPVSLTRGGDSRGGDLTSTHHKSTFGRERKIPAGLNLGDGANDDIAPQPLSSLPDSLERWSNNTTCRPSLAVEEGSGEEWERKADLKSA